MTDNTALSSLLLEKDSILSNLLDLSRRKKDALLTDDVETVTAIVGDEKLLVHKLQELSASLSSFLPIPSDPKLDSIKREIEVKLGEIKRINNQNQALLKQNLRLIQWELNLLVPKAGYGERDTIGPLVLDLRT
jgi:flagellar biosynthesis/type III secretory pathway chaperone